MNEISENNTEKSDFTAKIGMRDALLLTIGSVTGAGIYTLIGVVGKITGPGIILSFFLDLIIALLIASSYAECASVHTASGGGFVYIKQAYGEKALFVGWIIWLSNMAYASVVAISIGIFLGDLFNLHETWFIVSTSMGSVVLFTFFNAKGADIFSKIQNPITISVLLTFLIGGIYLFTKPPLGSFYPLLPFGILSVFTGSALLLDLFIGFEDICSISEEIKDSRKVVPKALIWSLLISGLFYFIVIISLFYSESLEKIIGSPVPFFDAIRSNPYVYYFVFIGAIFSLLVSVGVAVMASSRNLYALAKFDFIDRKWAEVNPKLNVPLRALLITLTLTLLILASGQVEFIASISNISYIISVVFVSATVIRFRKIKTYTKDSFKMPFYPYSSYLTIFLCLLLVIFIEPESILITVAWFLIGLVIYIFFSSKNRIIGTMFMVVLFFVSLTNIFVGLLILLGGILFYLFKIANPTSKMLTLTGIKLIMFFIMLIFWIYALDKTGVSIFLRVLFIIVLVVLSLNILFDIIPIQEIVTFVIKKTSKRAVAMQFGEQYIIIIKDSYQKFIRYFNKYLYICVFVVSIILGIIALLIGLDVFEPMGSNWVLGFISNSLFKFIWIGVLGISAFFFSISAGMMYLLNRK